MSGLYLRTFFPGIHLIQIRIEDDGQAVVDGDLIVPDLQLLIGLDTVVILYAPWMLWIKLRRVDICINQDMIMLALTVYFALLVPYRNDVGAN